MNTSKYSRTMAEAFGPYTSNQLEPMRGAHALDAAAGRGGAEKGKGGNRKSNRR